MTKTKKADKIFEIKEQKSSCLRNTNHSGKSKYSKILLQYQDLSDIKLILVI